MKLWREQKRNEHYWHTGNWYVDRCVCWNINCWTVQKGKQGLVEFHQQVYEERAKTEGNIAEPKAEQFYKSKNIPIIRYGFDQYDPEKRIEKKDFYKVPELIRAMPDNMIITSKAYFLEVKGCRDILKVKLVDMKGYDFWDKIMPIIVFVYSNSNKHCYRAVYPRLKELLYSMGTKGIYPDNNKEYLAVEVKELALIGEFCKI